MGHGRRWHSVVRPAALLRAGHQCELCGATDRLEADHVIPIKRGGSDHLDNVQVLCHSCHFIKTLWDNPQWVSRILALMPAAIREGLTWGIETAPPVIPYVRGANTPVRC